MSIFARLARKLDDIAIAMRFGTALRLRTYELEKQGLTTEQAELTAKQQMFDSMRKADVDITSYVEVKRWCKSFKQEKTEKSEI